MTNHFQETAQWSDNQLFSVFPRGYRNQKGKAVLATNPMTSQNIEGIYRYIISEEARWATEELRKMLFTATQQEMRDFKALHFKVATFSGIFNYRSARSLVARSPFMVLDIDDLSSTQEARDLQQKLPHDANIVTALSFVSPKAQGVKWVVELPKWMQGLTFRDQFETLRRYVGFHYGYDADKSGSDVCRACYLPWDSDCFINPQYLLLNTIK